MCVCIYVKEKKIGCHGIEVLVESDIFVILIYIQKFRIHPSIHLNNPFFFSISFSSFHLHIYIHTHIFFFF
ncbi:hypothetical protein BD770DRAFT_389165 [Pilaira anomala]|nr:hypothetical protein BD770DRAFT_389165 [Pilaira anomala]